jgi:hypothetical protein
LADDSADGDFGYNEVVFLGHGFSRITRIFFVKYFVLNKNAIENSMAFFIKNKSVEFSVIVKTVCRLPLAVF